MDFEQKSEEIWDRFRKGELTHDEVQTELDVLIQKYFPSFIKKSDFFERLENEISNRVHNKIPMGSTFRGNANTYFSKKAIETTKVVKESDFTNFWLSASWVENPSKYDKKTIKKLSVDDLTKYHILIFRSLIDLARNGYENSTQTKKLHEFLKLTKKAMLRHGVLKVRSDAFVEFLEHKQTYKSKTECLDEARKSGKFCPYCQSTNTFPNGNMYGCHDCKRSWRRRKKEVF